MQEDILIHGLDHSLAESRSSAIVPVGYTKKGDPTAASNLATEEQYAAILDFVATRTQEIGDAMKAGIIAPAPYRDGQRTPCSYCSYRSLCRHSYGEAPRWRKLKIKRISGKPSLPNSPPKPNNHAKKSLPQAYPHGKDFPYIFRHLPLSDIFP